MPLPHTSMKKALQPSELRHFWTIFGILIIFYAAWLIAVWPGILGQDSLASILEVETNQEFKSGKPAFWSLYAMMTYGPWRLVEVPIIIQLFLCSAVCARILSWMLKKGMRKSFLYCLFFVALAPSVVFYTTSLYSDGVYAIATTGMLFEIWRCHRNKKIDRAGFSILLTVIPFSLFSRPNGIINLLALMSLAYTLPRPEKIKFALVLIPSIIIISYAKITIKSHDIGTIFPVALYETVGFLELRPMGLWEHGEPRITPRTIDALQSTGQNLDHIREYYDHYYWDPLIFFPSGPALMSLPEKAKDAIVSEFFKYNLWHNFPAFAASRVNIFLYAAFADGGFPGVKNAENILPQTKSNSKIRFRSGKLHKMLSAWFDFTFKHRVIFWTPWLGLWLLLCGSLKTWQSRDVAGAVVCGTLFLQLAAIFCFSIAGEYRYLLAFFTAPLALLPVIHTPAKIPPETQSS